MKRSNLKRTPIARKPGSDAKVDFEYERCGVANIFMANEPLTGKRYVKVTERKTKANWAAFIKEIADEYFPASKRIRLVMDNLATHKPDALYEAFAPEEQKEFGTDLNLYILPSMVVGQTGQR